MLITSTFFDEWLVAEIDSESIQGSKIQVGLTDFVFDCSSVEDQEEMRVCKAFIDSLDRDMTSEEYVEYISMKFDGAEQSQINKYFDEFTSTSKKEHYPFEKPFHNIYKKELCISPMPALATHFTNINSVYGLSPFVDYKKLWDKNE